MFICLLDKGQLLVDLTVSTTDSLGSDAADLAGNPFDNANP
jgi:hypothetical protein